MKHQLFKPKKSNTIEQIEINTETIKGQQLAELFNDFFINHAVACPNLTDHDSFRKYKPDVDTYT